MYSYAPTSDFDALNKECVVALGCFDGVHIGHQTLLQHAKEEADKHGLSLVVYSPESKKNGFSLTTCSEKTALLHSYGADKVILANFDEIKSLSAETFVSEILCKELRCHTAVCGFNFRFGKNAAGDCRTLEKLLADRQKKTVVLPAVFYGEEEVSSTRIRTLLSKADMQTAEKLLSRPYFITGKVTKGRQIGRKLGFPTANCTFSQGKLIPPHGVYYCRVVTSKGTFGAISNIGIRPTFDDSPSLPLLEAHLFDFTEDLYGCDIKVEMIQFLRAEKRFSTPDALAAAVHQDIQSAKALAASDPIITKETI